MYDVGCRKCLFSTNQLKKIIWLGICFSFKMASAQNCTVPFQLVPTTKKGVIEWTKFPEFTLPFTIVYSGPRFNDQNRLPLKYGFSHLNTFTDSDFANLPRKNRALIHYGVAYLGGNTQQPWELIESPWNNNLSLYQTKWKNELKGFADQFADSKGKATPEVDLFVPDIERDKSTDAGILGIKTNASVPVAYQNLSNENFITRYKRDMQKLYSQPISYYNSLGLNSATKIASYADVPIRNTFVNIDGNSWDDWRTNTVRLNYEMQDTLSGQVGGSYYRQLGFLTPSAYYYYDYPSPFAGNYLAYLLFQIEANRAWSSKDLVVFEWMRFHPCCGSFLLPIKPFMAEASAIFPFFSGAKGIWLWEQSFSDQDNYASYEYFIYGLYRLSLFKDMFDGDYQLIIPKSARDHFESRDPVWRAVVKGNQILVAAHNPYATDTQVTSLPVSYGNWTTTLQLKGTEVFLCKFDLPTNLSNLFEVSVFPNPNTGTFTTRFILRQEKEVEIQVLDILGRQVYVEKLKRVAGENRVSLNLTNLSTGSYIMFLNDGVTKIQKRVMIVK